MDIKHENLSALSDSRAPSQNFCRNFLPADVVGSPRKHHLSFEDPCLIEGEYTYICIYIYIYIFPGTGSFSQKTGNGHEFVARKSSVLGPIGVHHQSSSNFLATICWSNFVSEN